MRGRLKACLLASLASLAGLAPGLALAQDAPDYGRFREGLFLRYLNPEQGALDRVPRIGITFPGGERLNADLDSGSTGIVVAAAYIPGFDQLPVQGPGELTYTSSGRVMVGQWVMTPVMISGRAEGSVQTEPMPVLGVTEVRCLENARDCTPNANPEHIAMVGVGFAREGDKQSQSTPDKNPLLRITGGPGPRRQGYVLSPEGVHVGLTAENTQGFRYLKLERNTEGTDWQATPACLTLNGATPPACGTALVDTGVGTMFMTVPQAQAQGAEGTLPDGTNVAVSVGQGEGAFPLYSFNVGDGSPMAPQGVHLRVSPERTFVNTSFHLLNGFDVLFDGEGGNVGFRAR